MQVCVGCKKEMRCKKNGIIVRWGTSHCYAGDSFKCPTCGNEVVVTNHSNYQSDKEVHPSILIQMD